MVAMNEVLARKGLRLSMLEELSILGIVGSLFVWSALEQLAYAAGFLIPAIFANTVPPIGHKIIRILRKKSPSNRILRRCDSPLFNLGNFIGENKTNGGTLFGIAAGTLLAYPFINVFIQASNMLLGSDNIPYGGYWAAFFLSVMVLTGDAIQSLFKRRVWNIEPGRDVPSDRYDWAIACALGLLAIPSAYPIIPNMAAAWFMLFTWLPIGSKVADLLGHALKIKKQKRKKRREEFKKTM